MPRNLFLIVLILFIFNLYLLPESFSGEIKNLNINASGGSQVNVNTTRPDKIKKIKVKKDDNSTVKFNEIESECNDNPSNQDLCTPPTF